MSKRTFGAIAGLAAAGLLLAACGGSGGDAASSSAAPESSSAAPESSSAAPAPTTAKVGVNSSTRSPRLNVLLNPIPRKPIVCSARLLE